MRGNNLQNLPASPNMDPEDVADFLGVYGWRLLEQLGYEELAERYVKPTGRKLVSMALERMVYAEKL
jgi:O-methyltransferase involved in polyketide biosynthesis